MLACLGAPESKSTTSSRSVQSFLHSSLQMCLYFTMGRTFPSKLPFPLGSGPPANTCFLGPTSKSSTQMAFRSIRTFFQGSLVWQTDRPRYSVDNNRPHHSACVVPRCGLIIKKQMVKVIWHKAASPPHMDGSIVFARWRQYAPPSNTCFLGPTAHPSPLIIRPHRSYCVRRYGLLLQTEWRGLSVCLSVTVVSPAKAAELHTVWVGDSSV